MPFAKYVKYFKYLYNIVKEREHFDNVKNKIRFVYAGKKLPRLLYTTEASVEIGLYFTNPEYLYVAFESTDERLETISQPHSGESSSFR